MPKKPEDLDNHHLVTYGEEGRLPFAEVNWILTVGKAKEERRASFKINNLTGIAKAVEAGVGIAGLPDYIAQSMPGVSKVLPDIKGPSTEAYFIYPTELRNSKRIKVFRDFIMRKLSEFRF